VAHARLGGGEPYLSAAVTTRGILPLGSRLRLAAAMQHTGVWLQRAGDELPLEDRLYAGGAGSVRGFSRHAVGPRDALERALGGNHRSELSLELRVALGRRWEAAVFADAGQLVRRGRALRLDAYAVGCGAGARLHTPLGLLRADLGFPVAGTGGEGAQLEAGVGQSF
jgi:translocation and assembly module TamA